MKNKKRQTGAKCRARGDAGFSLIELMIAMGVTVLVMGIASHLLASSVNIRAREDRRSDAISDVRRALNTITRETRNAGYALPSTLSGNGLVQADSNATQVRVISNLDHFSTAPGATHDTVSSQDEDVIYRWVNDVANNQSYILRFDVNSAINGSTVLANRIDSMVIRYFDRKVTYTAGTCQQGIDMTTVRNSANVLQAEVPPSQANYLVIAVCVQMPPVGTPGSPGYEAASRTQLISDVQLRNADVTQY